MSLTLSQKAGWGLADMGIVVFVMVKQLLVLAFLTTVMGIPAAIAGAVTTVVLLFDIVTDPLVGWLSDRTRGRWGRRAPWLFFGALVMPLGMAAMFAVPEGMAQGAVLAWVVGFFGLATIGFTMCAVPYAAMAGELTQDPRERSTMTGWRMGFASIGILIGGALIPGLAAGRGHGAAMVIVAPAMVAAIWLSLWLVRRAPRIESPAMLSLPAALSLVLGNRPFTILVTLYGVMSFAVALITAALPFAALYLIVDDGLSALSGAAEALTTLSLLFAAFVVGALVSQVIWVLLSRRLGKLGALVLGLVLYAALLLALYRLLPATNVTLMAGLFILAGMTNGAYQQIPWAMYPDLMDITRRDHGQAVEGSFSAVWLFGQKLANALAPAALGLFLSSRGWQETTEGVVEQSAAALRGLQLSVTVLPAAVLVLAILGLLFVYRPAVQRQAANE